MESIFEFVKQFLLNPNVQTTVSGIVGTWLVTLFPEFDPYREYFFGGIWVIIGAILVGNKWRVEPVMVQVQGMTLAQAAYRPFARPPRNIPTPLQPGGFER